MKIAFDAIPLLGRMTGIGYCEAGQVKAMTRLHPEHRYTLNYFAARHLQERAADLAPYLGDGVSAKHAFCVPYAYRAVSTFIPIPYRWFFGRNDLTHFFNYIIPPGVGGKTVVTVHDMVCKAFPETVRGRTKAMLDAGLVPSMRRADAIVTDSEFSRSEIVKYFPQFEEKLRVVPCGVDLDRFRPVRDAAQIAQVRARYGVGERYFLYLGTLEPRKNLERLIDAYAAYARQTGEPAQLVLAGGKGWLYQGIFEKVQTLGLTERVIFTQYIASEDMCALMSGALAFTFPSIYEGFGMPPLEAMACGTPVLVSDAASLPEVTGKSAVIVRAEDTDSITAGLVRLDEDAALRARLSQEGLARAQGFTWARSAAMLYDVYTEILGMTAPTVPGVSPDGLPPAVAAQLVNTHWEDLTTAYGNAVHSSYDGKYNVPALLRRLFDNDEKAAARAADALDDALCHQHVGVWDAAVPAYPIILARLAMQDPAADSVLTETLLELCEGLAHVTDPAFREEMGVPDRKTPAFFGEIRGMMQQDLAVFGGFSANANADAAETAAAIVSHLIPKEDA